MACDSRHCDPKWNWGRWSCIRNDTGGSATRGHRAGTDQFRGSTICHQHGWQRTMGVDIPTDSRHAYGLGRCCGRSGRGRHGRGGGGNE